MKKYQLVICHAQLREAEAGTWEYMVFEADNSVSVIINARAEFPAAEHIFIYTEI